MVLASSQLINLIPYNSTSVAADYRAPPRDVSEAFQTILHSTYNLFTTIRVEMGADIDGACGQLALENQELGTMRPRGLKDDDETAAPAGSPVAAATGGCATGGGGSADIEDMVPTSKRATPTIARKVTKTITAASPPKVEPAQFVPAPLVDDASIEFAAATLTESSTPESDSDEDTVTVGELLARSGVKPFAATLEKLDADAPPATDPSATPAPYLLPTEKKIVAKIEQTKRDTYDAQRPTRYAIAALVLILVPLTAMLIARLN
jgi:hypothetical protein